MKMGMVVEGGGDECRCVRVFVRKTHTPQVEEKEEEEEKVEVVVGRGGEARAP
jgi:hypothetical protein